MFPPQPGGIGPAGATPDLAGLQRRVQSRSSVVLCTGGSAVAGVAELADAADSKSAVGNSVRVSCAIMHPHCFGNASKVEPMVPTFRRLEQLSGHHNL